jgi:hypothetical protein
MVTKEKITITLNIKNNEILNSYCEKNLINKSKLINHLIDNFLKNNNLIDDKK